MRIHRDSVFRPESRCILMYLFFKEKNMILLMYLRVFVCNLHVISCYFMFMKSYLDLELLGKYGKCRWFCLCIPMYSYVYLCIPMYAYVYLCIRMYFYVFKCFLNIKFYTLI